MAEKPLPDKLAGREVLLEFTPVGNIMRVAAMDAASMTEIVVQCPVGAGEAAFRKAALARLEYVLRKKGLISAG
jgi:hypothetical protein